MWRNIYFIGLTLSLLFLLYLYFASFTDIFLSFDFSIESWSVCINSSLSLKTYEYVTCESRARVRCFLIIISIKIKLSNRKIRISSVTYVTYFICFLSYISFSHIFSCLIIYLRSFVYFLNVITYCIKRWNIFLTFICNTHKVVDRLICHFYTFYLAQGWSLSSN